MCPLIRKHRKPLKSKCKSHPSLKSRRSHLFTCQSHPYSCFLCIRHTKNKHIEISNLFFLFYRYIKVTSLYPTISPLEWTKASKCVYEGTHDDHHHLLCAQLCLTFFVTLHTVTHQAPWKFPGKSTGVGCRFLLQGNFLTQESNQHHLQLLI